jgi:hypothetical protein
MASRPARARASVAFPAGALSYVQRMEPVDATLALIQLVNDYRCAIYAECQPESTDVASSHSAGRSSARSWV